eukprot:COSAG02_NODE_1502_length_12258_cov_12.486142_6_plen_87_part_00
MIGLVDSRVAALYVGIPEAPSSRGQWHPVAASGIHDTNYTCYYENYDHAIHVFILLVLIYQVHVLYWRARAAAAPVSFDRSCTPGT